MDKAHPFRAKFILIRHEPHPLAVEDVDFFETFVLVAPWCESCNSPFQLADCLEDVRAVDTALLSFFNARTLVNVDFSDFRANKATGRKLNVPSS